MPHIMPPESVVAISQAAHAGTQYVMVTFASHTSAVEQIASLMHVRDHLLAEINLIAARVLRRDTEPNCLREGKGSGGETNEKSTAYK